MSESRFEVMAGAAVLLLAVGFLYFLLQNDAPPGGGDSYHLSARFNSAQGVSVGSDVRMAGVKIGAVSGMELNREDYTADLRISIQSGILIPEDSSAAIMTDSLLGGYFVEIEPGGSFINLNAGEEIFDTQGYVGLMQLLTDFFFSQL